MKRWWQALLFSIVWIVVMTALYVLATLALGREVRW